MSHPWSLVGDEEPALKRKKLFHHQPSFQPSGKTACSVEPPQEIIEKVGKWELILNEWRRMEQNLSQQARFKQEQNNKSVTDMCLALNARSTPFLILTCPVH